jgi:hypothetical protein
MTVEARMRCEGCGSRLRVKEGEHGEAIAFCPGGCLLKLRNPPGVSQILTREEKGIKVPMTFGFFRSLFPHSLPVVA